jgi:predicted exporter
VIALWAGFIVACIAIISRTEFSADLSAFLPRSPTAAQRVLVEQLRDGVVARLILIAVQGEEPATLADISTRLAEKLRKESGSFVSVDNGEDRGLEKDREYLWRERYLLSPAVTPQHFSAPALREALEQDLQLLRSPASPLLLKILNNDPTGELLLLTSELESQQKPATQQGVWFSPDGKRALLVAQTKAAGYDLDAQQQALALIGKAFAEVSHSDAHMTLTGPGVIAVKMRSTIKGDAARLSLIATFLVAALLLFLYRSPRVLALGLAPVVSGALAGISAVSLAFGSVHGITLGFGVTLIGEGVDYAIYLFTQIAPGSGPRNTLERIWSTLRLGALTSICGFSAMLLSGFPGLSQLGLFSIAGLIAALAVTRWVLPMLLPTGFAAPIVTGLEPNLMGAVRAAPLLRVPLLALVLLAVGVLALHRGPLWSSELSSLSPVSEHDRLLDEGLRRDLGAPDVRHLIVIGAVDQERALQASEQVVDVLRTAVQRGDLAGFESPSQYLPSRRTQAERQAALPERATLQQDLTRATQRLGFVAGTFAPFIADVEAARHRPLLDRQALEGTRLASKVDSLLVKRGDGWAAMLPLHGVANAEQIASKVAAINGSPAVMLDLKRESDSLYQSYRQQALTYSLLGVSVIVALLVISLRSPRRVFDVLAPLAAAVVVTTAVLTLGAQNLSIFHLVGLLLVVAVGSNYSLFFDREAASVQDRARTVVSLLFANASTVIGFGLLAFSAVPVLKAIGSTVGLGAVLGLLFSAVLIERTAPAAEV